MKDNIAVVSIFIVILFFSYAGWFMLQEQDYYADELPHANQIFKFMRNDYRLVTYLTVIPGYHLFIATLTKIFDMPITLSNLRLISAMAMTFLMIPLFYNMTKGDFLKTLQLYFWPSIHIFYFLVYTDIFSAFFVLASFYYATKEKYDLSGILISMSMLIRQNNFFWLGFLILYLLFKSINQKSIDFKQLLINGKTYILSGVCFVLFVLLNSGVVLGVDKVSHPISFHLGNIWFSLFILFFLMLPVILSKFIDMGKYVLKHPKILILLFGIVLIGLGTSVNDHVYNQNNVFLKNKILNWAYSSPINAILYMIPVVLTILYLMITKLNIEYAWLMYPITFVYLSLSWMVEVRYYTIPFLLFIILREKTDKIVEFEQLIYQILISLIMFFGIYYWKIFW